MFEKKEILNFNTKLCLLLLLTKSFYVYSSSITDELQVPYREEIDEHADSDKSIDDDTDQSFSVPALNLDDPNTDQDAQPSASNPFSPFLINNGQPSTQSNHDAQPLVNNPFALKGLKERLTSLELEAEKLSQEKPLSVESTIYSILKDRISEKLKEVSEIENIGPDKLKEFEDFYKDNKDLKKNHNQLFNEEKWRFPEELKDNVSTRAWKLTANKAFPKSAPDPQVKEEDLLKDLDKELTGDPVSSKEKERVLKDILDRKKPHGFSSNKEFYERAAKRLFKEHNLSFNNGKGIDVSKPNWMDDDPDNNRKIKRCWVFNLGYQGHDIIYDAIAEAEANYSKEGYQISVLYTPSKKHAASMDIIKNDKGLFIKQYESALVNNATIAEKYAINQTNEIREYIQEKYAQKAEVIPSPTIVNQVQSGPCGTHALLNNLCGLTRDDDKLLDVEEDKLSINYQIEVEPMLY